MKRSKLPLIIVLIVLGVLIAGGALTYVITLNNGTLYRIGGVQKIYDLTHLCVQHHYIDADCENPDRCEICGSEKGEALGHDWTEATCTTPRTCSVCGKTEGTTAPHDWDGCHLHHRPDLLRMRRHRRLTPRSHHRFRYMHSLRREDNRPGR